MLARLTVVAFAFVSVCLSAMGQDKPLALHPDNPHYFLFRGKPAVLITSTEHYGAVLNTSFDYVKYLDELARHKLNLTRTFSGTYREIPESFGITDNTLAPKGEAYLAPWARTEQGGAGDGLKKFDLERFDPKYFERLKAFVTEAGKRGVVVEYVLFCTLYNDKLWDVNAMNPKNVVNDLGAATINRREVFALKHPKLTAYQEAFVRKAVTELNGFDNLYFEICNEPYFEGVSDEWQAHIAKVIAETEGGLPNRHLVAQNIANDKKKVERVTPNVSILNFHYATPPETVEMNYQHNLPISDDETGFRGKEDVHYRTEAWDFVLAGGAGYDNLDYSFTPGHPDGTLDDYKSPGGGSRALREQLSILKTFMEGLDFVKMKPMNSAIKSGTAIVPVGGRRSSADSAKVGSMTIRCLAEPGKQYAIYLRGGTAAQLALDLPAGKYKADWVNTKTGKVENSDTIEGSATTRVTAPDYQEDVALRIVRVE
jgi:hypothetical protein